MPQPPTLSPHHLLGHICKLVFCNFIAHNNYQPDQRLFFRAARCKPIYPNFNEKPQCHLIHTIIHSLTPNWMSRCSPFCWAIHFAICSKLIIICYHYEVVAYIFFFLYHMHIGTTSRFNYQTRLLFSIFFSSLE